jgi:hypothetical protein
MFGNNIYFLVSIGLNLRLEFPVFSMYADCFVDWPISFGESGLNWALIFTVWMHITVILLGTYKYKIAYL